MTVIEDKPTMEERYTRATESSNLKYVSHRVTDVDVLIAAGMEERRLGTLLYRLKSEFDSVRAEMRSPENLSPTDRLLILSHLKTLREAKTALGAFAIVKATQRSFMETDETVLKLVGRVLDVHLDPLCHHCDGRGFTGGAHRGDKQVFCRPCRGTGSRKTWIGQNPSERWFAQFLLAEMDRVLSAASGRIAARLRHRDT